MLNVLFFLRGVRRLPNQHKIVLERKGPSLQAHTTKPFLHGFLVPCRLIHKKSPIVRRQGILRKPSPTNETINTCQLWTPCKNRFCGDRGHHEGILSLSPPPIPSQINVVSYSRITLRFAPRAIDVPDTTDRTKNGVTANRSPCTTASIKIQQATHHIVPTVILAFESMLVLIRASQSHPLFPPAPPRQAQKSTQRCDHNTLCSAPGGLILFKHDRARNGGYRKTNSDHGKQSSINIHHPPLRPPAHCGLIKTKRETRRNIFTPFFLVSITFVSPLQGPIMCKDRGHRAGRMPLYCRNLLSSIASTAAASQDTKTQNILYLA